MYQPFIFKKQIFSIIVVFMTLLLSFLFKVNKTYTTIEFFYLILLLTITFLPSLKRKFEYPIFIHYILYYFPLILPLIFVNIDHNLNFNIYYIILSILIGMLLRLISYFFEEKNLLYNTNFTLTQISTNEFLADFFGTSFAIIGEEIFFRYFLIELLYIRIGLLSIIISSILFVYTHYVNRWANVMFNKKTYLFHFILGIVLSYFLCCTNSFMGCIIIHAIFNSHQFVRLFKRYRVRTTTTQFFDDY